MSIRPPWKTRFSFAERRCWKYMIWPNPPSRQSGCTRTRSFINWRFSREANKAAAAYGDGFVRVWDWATLQLTETLKGVLLGFHSVTFSPDGTRLAAGSNGQEAVKLWDAHTLQELLTLAGRGSVFSCLKFSPDGRFLLAVSLEGWVHVWSAPSWAEIEAMEKVEGK